MDDHKTALRRPHPETLITRTCELRADADIYGWARHNHRRDKPSLLDRARAWWREVDKEPEELGQG